jgi:hypothetical protein
MKMEQGRESAGCLERYLCSTPLRRDTPRARYRRADRAFHLGKHFGADPAHVEAQVIGDHGTSQVFLWSSARIGEVPVAALLERRGERLGELRQKLEKRRALRQHQHHRGP